MFNVSVKRSSSPGTGTRPGGWETLLYWTVEVSSYIKVVMGIFDHLDVMAVQFLSYLGIFAEWQYLQPVTKTIENDNGF